MEGIVEAIIDHHYSDGIDVQNTVYWDVWVSYYQKEATIAQMDVTRGYDHTLYGPDNLQWYRPEAHWPVTNPVLLFFYECLNAWYNTNPFNLPNDYRENNTPLSISGFVELAHIFRFVNRFYPSIIGHIEYSEYNCYDQVLADWIASHLDLSDAAILIGLGINSNIFSIVCGLVNLPVAAATYFTLLMTSIEANLDLLAGIAHPQIHESINANLANDARSLVSLMLSNMSKADEIAYGYPDKINIHEYNRLKNSILFTNPNSTLDQLWNEYEELGCRIYAEVGPTGSTQNWYYRWSPWRKQTMTWGVYSSLNNLLPEIYESNPNVAVYDSYFQIGPIVVQGPQPYSVFQTYSTARINLDLFNTKDVASQSLNLVVKRDHNSQNYGSDGVVNSTGAFSIDQNPINYGSVNRLTKYLDFPVSINDLADNKGYYYELKNQTSNKPIFGSSFEQYQNCLALTSNYYRLYDTYKKWPYSLGVERNVYTVTLNPPKVEDTYQSGSYLINGLSTSSIVAEEDAFISIEAIPGNPNENFFKWTDGNTTNPRQYKVQSVNNIYAIMKKAQLSNDQSAYSNNSQRKFMRTENGYLHNVYQSRARVWYERSTNNGATWEIMNDAKPLSDVDSKSPSIAVAGNKVLIVFQEKNGVNSKIILLMYDDNYLLGPQVISDGFVEGPYQTDLMPVISYKDGDYPQRVNTLIIWRAPNSGSFNYIYRRGDFWSNDFSCGRLHDLIQDQGGQYLNGNSTNLAVSFSQSDNFNHRFFSLAWEQFTNSNVSKINHCNLKEYYYMNYNNPQWILHPFGGIITVSNGSPFAKNSRPSIVSYVTASNIVTARICWVGERRIDQIPNYTE